MKIWESDGHLAELALELRAAAEAESGALQAMDDHLATCATCRAREAEWQGLFHALASLQAVEPSVGFAAAVMERVHVPSRARSPVTARWSSLVRRLRPIAIAAAAAWTAVVGGGVWWLQGRVDAPPAVLLAELASQAGGVLLAVVIKVTAFLQTTGVLEAIGEWGEAVPGQGLALALSIMTMLSGVAIWTLYRVTAYQPSRVRANA